VTTTTVHRILKSMESNHLLRQTVGKRYALGPLLLQLANSGAMPRDLYEAALPVMSALRDELDETIGLHELLESGQCIVVAQVENRQGLRRTYTDIGVPVPLDCEGAGNAILCALPHDHWARLVDKPTPPNLDTPTVDPVELLDARRRGFAMSVEKRNEGLVSISAPVFDHTQRVVGALAASIPQSRISAESGETIGARLREMSWHLSAALGATAEGVRALVHDIGLG
jgi:IclR family acetate operon transcriptional repressor